MYYPTPTPNTYFIHSLLPLPYRRLSTRTGEYLSKIHVFRETLRNFMPKTFACMEALRALEPKFLNLIFMDFFKTLLPRMTVLRIVDSYLLEVCVCGNVHVCVWAIVGKEFVWCEGKGEGVCMCVWVCKSGCVFVGVCMYICVRVCESMLTSSYRWSNS